MAQGYPALTQMPGGCASPSVICVYMGWRQATQSRLASSASQISKVRVPVKDPASAYVVRTRKTPEVNLCSTHTETHMHFHIHAYKHLCTPHTYRQRGAHKLNILHFPRSDSLNSRNSLDTTIKIKCPLKVPNLQVLLRGQGTCKRWGLIKSLSGTWRLHSKEVFGPWPLLFISLPHRHYEVSNVLPLRKERCMWPMV